MKRALVLHAYECFFQLNVDLNRLVTRKVQKLTFYVYLCPGILIF
jgi:hypothetical protein